jgi:hypothetical protein
MAKRTLPTEALGFFRRTGREGGKLGGKAAAESMTPEERTARAKKAAALPLRLFTSHLRACRGEGEMMLAQVPHNPLDGDLDAALAAPRSAWAAAACQALDGGLLNTPSFHLAIYMDSASKPVSVSFDPRPAGFAGARQGKTPPPGVTDSGRPVKWSPAPATSHACSTNTRRETSAACFFPRKAGLVDVVHMHRRLKDQVAASFPALELPPIRPTTDLPKAIREPSPDSALTDS